MELTDTRPGAELAPSAARATGAELELSYAHSTGAELAPSAAPEMELSAARSTGTWLAPSAAPELELSAACAQHRGRAGAIRMELFAARNRAELALSAQSRPPRATGTELELSRRAHITGPSVLGWPQGPQEALMCQGRVRP